jgi:protein-disulfide isomerase
VSNQTAGGPRTGARAALLSWARRLAVALTAALAAACAGQGDPPEAGAAALDPAEGVHLFAGIPQHGDVLGEAAAPVTLVELSDLRCSHCRDFAAITLPVLVDRYVRTGRLRIVFGDLPILGPDSVQAARMAAAAGLQDHLFELTEAFFSDEPMRVDDTSERRIALEVPGLDVDAAMAARSSAAVDDVLEQARGLAARFSIWGTPSFLLGRARGNLVQLDDVWPAKPETLTPSIDRVLEGG